MPCEAPVTMTVFLLAILTSCVSQSLGESWPYAVTTPNRCLPVTPGGRTRKGSHCQPVTLCCAFAFPLAAERLTRFHGSQVLPRGLPRGKTRRSRQITSYQNQTSLRASDRPAITSRT